MESLGYLQRIGVTPTDILHAEGSLDIYDRESAEICIQYLADKSSRTKDCFINDAKLMIKTKLCTELMKVLLSEEGINEIDASSVSFLNKAITHQSGKDYGCRIKVNKPIIGIGAPSGVYIRWVGEAFDTDVIIHKDSNVGNAVGAIATSITESIDFLIKPKMIGSEDSGFEIFSKAGTFNAETLEEAQSKSEEIGKEYVLDLIAKDGAIDVTIDVERTTNMFGYGNSNNTSLMDMTLRIIAAGKPAPFNNKN